MFVIVTFKEIFLGLSTLSTLGYFYMPNTTKAI